MNTPIEARKIIVCDGSKHKFAPFIESLEKSGAQAVFCLTHEELIAETFKGRPPEIIFSNLILNGKNIIPTIKEIRKRPGGAHPKIVIMTAQKSLDNIRECIKAGANDFIIEPTTTEFLIQRTIYHLQQKSTFTSDEIANSEGQVDFGIGFRLLYESLKNLSENTDAHEGLMACLKSISEIAKAPRVSVYVANLETNQALVLATSDNAGFKNKKINIDQYPEVKEVLVNSLIIFIKDITSNPLTKDIQAQVKDLKIASLLVIPIRHRQECIGALSIKLDENSLKDVTQKHLKTFFGIAFAMSPKVAALKLVNKKILDESVPKPS